MTWFRVDDGVADHPKYDKAGPKGRALWFDAGSRCARRDSGVVDPKMLGMAAVSAGVSARAAARALVDAGLWHDHVSMAECDRCVARVGPIEAGYFYFHDWDDYQYEGKADSIERERDNRRKRLNKNKPLQRLVRSRDRDMCRYCGVTTTGWSADGRRSNDQRSKRAGCFDHLDPWGENELGNVVVACRACNSSKRQRTLLEWGRPLLDPGTTKDEADVVRAQHRTHAPGSQAPVLTPERAGSGARNAPVISGATSDACARSGGTDGEA